MIGMIGFSFFAINGFMMGRTLFSACVVYLFYLFPKKLDL